MLSSLSVHVCSGTVRQTLFVRTCDAYEEGLRAVDAARHGQSWAAPSSVLRLLKLARTGPFTCSAASRDAAAALLVGFHRVSAAQAARNEPCR